MTKHLRITVEGKVYDVVVEDLTEDTGSTFYQMPSVSAPPPKPVAAAPAVAPTAAKPAPAGGKSITSPMGGVIVEIKVSVGQSVTSGQEAVVLEAMKMKQVIVTEFSGTVTGIPVKVGDTVDAGQILISLG